MLTLRKPPLFRTHAILSDMSVPSRQALALHPTCSSSRLPFGRGMHGRRTGSGRPIACHTLQTAHLSSPHLRLLVTARERLRSSVPICRWPAQSPVQVTCTSNVLRRFPLLTPSLLRTVPAIRTSRWVLIKVATPSPLYISLPPRPPLRLSSPRGRTGGARFLAPSLNVYHSPSMTRGSTRPRSRATTSAIRSPTLPASRPSRPPPSRRRSSARLEVIRTRSTPVCRHDTN